jgi:hypothetical protein
MKKLLVVAAAAFISPVMPADATKRRSAARNESHLSNATIVIQAQSLYAPLYGNRFPRGPAEDKKELLNTGPARCVSCRSARRPSGLYAAAAAFRRNRGDEPIALALFRLLFDY